MVDTCHKGRHVAQAAGGAPDVPYCRHHLGLGQRSAKRRAYRPVDGQPGKSIAFLSGSKQIGWTHIACGEAGKGALGPR
jgi:hypothetical protein